MCGRYIAFASLPLTTFAAERAEEVPAPSLALQHLKSQLLAPRLRFAAFTARRCRPARGVICCGLACRAPAVRSISARFLSQDERIEIADLHHAGLSVRQSAPGYVAPSRARSPPVAQATTATAAAGSASGANTAGLGEPVMSGRLGHPGGGDRLPQRRFAGPRGEELHPHFDWHRLASHSDLRINKEGRDHGRCCVDRVKPPTIRGQFSPGGDSFTRAKRSVCRPE